MVSIPYCVPPGGPFLKMYKFLYIMFWLRIVLLKWLLVEFGNCIFVFSNLQVEDFSSFVPTFFSRVMKLSGFKWLWFPLIKLHQCNTSKMHWQWHSHNRTLNLAAEKSQKLVEIGDFSLVRLMSNRSAVRNVFDNPSAFVLELEALFLFRRRFDFSGVTNTRTCLELEMMRHFGMLYWYGMPFEWQT